MDFSIKDIQIVMVNTYSAYTHRYTNYFYTKENDKQEVNNMLIDRSYTSIFLQFIEHYPSLLVILVSLHLFVDFKCS